jgi:UDP-N-acetylglucosamine 2-epimerase (non-hydrolysing)
LTSISRHIPLVFAIHPRTKAKLAEHALSEALQSSRILTTPPLPYLQTIGLLKSARFVITDSGGVQEETTALGVPCLTARENTERPITITDGTNTLVGTSAGALERAAIDILATGGKRGRIPEFWDGRAAERVAERVAAYLEANARPS